MNFKLNQVHKLKPNWSLEALLGQHFPKVDLFATDDNDHLPEVDQFVGGVEELTWLDSRSFDDAVGCQYCRASEQEMGVGIFDQFLPQFGLASSSPLISISWFTSNENNITLNIKADEIKANEIDGKIQKYR